MKMKTLSLSSDNLSAFKQRAFLKSTYNILDLEFSIHADHEGILKIFEQAYERFKAIYDNADYHFYVITQNSPFGQPFVIFNNQLHLIYGNELIYSHAYMLILNELIDRIRNYFLFHAGVVSKGETGVLIVGPSSFGKTTMTLELVRRGFTFLSDEFCPIDRVNKRIYSFPRSLNVREGSLTILNKIPPKNLLAVKNIGRGSKLVMDIKEWKEGNVGTSTLGKYVFFLRGKKFYEIDDSVKLIDLALIEEDKKLISQLQMITNTKMISKTIVECYFVYRFELKQRAGLMFQEICKNNSQKILYIESISTDVPEYNSEPFLREVPLSKAIIEMMRNLRNRSQNSSLVKDFNSQTQLFMKVGEIVKQMRCYNLSVGKLDKMAELIIKTVEA